MQVSIEKPGTPAELVHHGVKGQKWGVRRKREQNRQFSRSFNRANPSRSERNKAIINARKRVYKGKGSVSRKDQAIAMRMTTGEKVITGLLASTGIATVPIAAIVAGQAIERRRVERLA